jgi:mannose-6-phosphate isomerase-like protein (cupin superfamily)
MSGMDTTCTPATFELGRETLVHLGPDLTVTALAVDDAFWTHRAADRPELAEGRIVCLGDYGATWSWWERHPDGDELVLVVSGQVDFVLEDESGRRTVTLAADQCAIVPAGTWHRAVVDAPCRMLFVTPTPARTQLREAQAPS